MAKDTLDHLTGVVTCGRCGKRFPSGPKWRNHMRIEDAEMADQLGADD